MADLRPFQRSANRRFDAAVEFKAFQKKAPGHIREAIANRPRFKALDDLFSFYVDAPSSDTVEARFGTRSMFRTGPHGKLGMEEGPTLHYSLGGGGDVVVSLYPCHSNLARTFESQIHLRIGRYTAHQLLSRVPSDVADLVAYGHVSSFDGDPAIAESFRIWLLRKTRSMQVGGRFVKPAMLAHLYRGLDYSSKSLLSAAFLSVLKPIGLVIAAFLLGYLGFTHLADLIRPK